MTPSMSSKDAPAVEADAQAIHVVAVLHEQAERMTEQAAHTTLEADVARVEVVRLDAQADQYHARAARLHGRADALSAEVAEITRARAAGAQTQQDG
jgi:hypothetical protein